LNSPIQIKRGALLGHLIANNPKDNLNFITQDEENEDEIEENIYIPNDSKQKKINSKEFKTEIEQLTKHLKDS